jgi:uncharacterized membrane protein YgcG
MVQPSAAAPMGRVMQLSPATDEKKMDVMERAFAEAFATCQIQRAGITKERPDCIEVLPCGDGDPDGPRATSDERISGGSGSMSGGAMNGGSMSGGAMSGALSGAMSGTHGVAAQSMRSFSWPPHSQAMSPNSPTAPDH